ncbi:MAG: long-chain-fatty-acid--CoA ligase [Porticoccaceae bacterium]|nr:long-chain-fatty-acid--CoA ligase [Porticoccaceae bacterium]
MIALDKLNCVADISRYQATINGSRIAQIFEGRETTYSQLDTRASQVANGLINAGCIQGSRIGYLGKNSDYYFEVMSGTAKANVVIAGVNWRLAMPEVEYILNDACVEILFVGAEFYDMVMQLAPNLPAISQIIAIDGNHHKWVDYCQWRDSQNTADPLLPISLEDDVLQLYTSGTTGHPKGVQLTNGNYLDVLDQAANGGWGDWDEGEASIVAMPIFHVAGVNVGVVGLAQGLVNVVLKDVDPVVILDLLEKYRVKYAFFVPAVILFMNSIPGVRDRDFSNLDFLLYGASPISEDVLLTAKDIFKCNFCQVYGLTETCGAGTILPPEDHDPARGKLRSCGKAAPTAEVRILDNDGSILAPNQVGEITYRSKSLMKGYWNNSEATAKTIQNGWFFTGDAGYMDEEGYLYIHDRIKDMIVSGGENIYPAEVENALFDHAAVGDVAVIGVPDEKWGEAVKAVVVLKPGATATEEDLIAHSRSKIAGYKIPKSVDFTDTLPRNPTGKLLKRELRKPYWQGKNRQIN